MGNNKDIKITSCIMDITIHFNPLIGWAQIGLVIACFLTILLSSDEVVRNCIYLVLLLDLVVILGAIIRTSKITKEASASKTEASKPKKADSATSTEIKNKVSPNTPTASHKSVKPPDGVVKKSSDLPKEPTPDSTPAPAPAPEPAPELPKADDNAPLTKKKAEEMTVDDWAQLFTQ